MRILYTLLIYIHTYLACVVSMFSSKARDWVEGRKNLLRKMRLAKGNAAPCIWVHCASLGEFEQGRPVIEELRNQFPEFKILLTFFSPSGYNIRKNYTGADWVFYLPADTQRNAKKFLEIWNPTLAVFVKYEFWFNYLHALQKRKIPTVVVSAHFRPASYFFQAWAFWFREHLLSIDWFFVQNNLSLQLLKSIGMNRVTVSGDTRFDRVAAISQKPLAVNELSCNTDETPILIAGSTWAPDEDLLLDLINDHKIHLRYIIVPHEVHHAQIKSLSSKVSGGAQILSQITQGNYFSARVLIVDKMGLLSSLYRYGSLAYIGGGFGRGIHNTLEAATFGLPVIFGPNYRNFAEAVDLERLGGAFSVKNKSELKDIVLQFLNNPSKRIEAGRICSDYVQANTGATPTIIRELKTWLKPGE